MKTPKRKLQFSMVDETPAPSKKGQKCVLVHYPAGKWVPAVLAGPVQSGTVRVLLYSGSHHMVKLGDIKLFMLRKDDKLRVRDDERTYRVIATLSPRAKGPWRLETGEDVVELAAGRSTRTIKTPVKNVFFYTENAAHLPDYDPRSSQESVRKRQRKETNATPMRAPKPKGTTKGAPEAVRAAAASSIYYDSLQLEPVQVFTDCVFIVDADLTGTRARLIKDNGGTVTTADTFFAGNTLNCPPTSKFFAIIGPSISAASPYLEALAIGWPCLDPAFIDEALAQGSMGSWKAHLHAVVAGGIVRSQTVGHFEHQWARGRTLEHQFRSRNVFLEAISAPLHVSGQLSPILLRVVALARPSFEVSELEEVPAGCVFIGHTEDEPFDRHELMSQPRLEQTVRLSAEWLLRCVLGQTV